MQRRDETTIENLDIDSVVQILDGFPITLAILFGSYARGEATNGSDIDIAVEFDDSLTSSERTRNRFALIEQLSTTMETDNIDVIPLAYAHSTLVEDIFTDGILIYGSTESLTDDQYRQQEYITHTDRLDQFENILTDLEQVV